MMDERFAPTGAVLDVLSGAGEMTLHAIAHAVAEKRNRRITADQVLFGIEALRRRGLDIVEHDDADSVRYELVEPPLGAA